MTIKELRTRIALTSTNLAIEIVLDDEKEIIAYDSDGLFYEGKFEEFCKSSKNQYDLDNLEVDRLYGGIDNYGEPTLIIVCLVYT